MSSVKDKYVAIIDYELGNLFSVKHACEAVGLETRITTCKQEILESAGVIIPGVGSFGDAMASLERKDLIEPLKDIANSGKPFLGICLGYQLLFTESEEFGFHKGLDLIPGVVSKLQAIKKTIKIPFIGWNRIVKSQNNTSILNGIESDELMYFIHSYYAAPDDHKTILTTTCYEDVVYCSGVNSKNINGFQFHPEKSGNPGIKIYQNFKEMVALEND